MAVKIKLKRMGKIRAPYYRIVVADSRTKRDGRVIEEIGKYHPTQEPSLIEVDSERAQYWLGVGAQPTEPVAAILKITGDWQKFKGLTRRRGRCSQPEPTVLTRRARFEAVAASRRRPRTPRRRRGRAVGPSKTAEPSRRRPRRPRLPPPADSNETPEA